MPYFSVFVYVLCSRKFSENYVLFIKYDTEGKTQQLSIYLDTILFSLLYGKIACK